MALQLRRLFSTSCLHRSFSNPSKLPSAMLQYRSVQNFPNNSVLPSFLNHTARFKKLAQLGFSKGTTTPCLQLRIRSPYTTGCRGRLVSGIADYGFRLNLSAYEFISKRLFSSKSKKKFKKKFAARGKSAEAGDRAVLGNKKTTDGSSTSKMADRSKKHGKSPVNGITASGQRKIAAASTDPSSKIATKSSNSINDTTGASKTVKQFQDTKKKMVASKSKVNIPANKDRKAGDNAVVRDKKIADGHSIGKKVDKPDKNVKSQNTCPDSSSKGASKSSTPSKSSKSISGTTNTSKSVKQIQDGKKKTGVSRSTNNILAKKNQKAANNAVVGDKKTSDGHSTGKTVHQPEKHVKSPIASPDPSSKGVSKSSKSSSSRKSNSGATKASEGAKQPQDGKKNEVTGNSKANSLVKKDQKAGDNTGSGNKKIGDGNSSGKMALRLKKHVKLPNSCGTVNGQIKIAPSSRDTPSKGASKMSKSVNSATNASASKKQLQYSNIKKGAVKTKASTAAKKDQNAVKTKASTAAKKDQNARGVEEDKGLSRRSASAVSETKKLKNTGKKSSSPVSRIAKNSNKKSIEPAKNDVLQFSPLYPPSGRSVMVVESATKAKVIQNYLGDMFEVLPSYGHVRDLAAKSRSVRPDDDFSMVWEVPATAWTHLKSIKMALSGAENLILASDPDREGEAIAWHIIEMLQQQDALNENVNVRRVVFHEITESSVRNALKMPREIDANLVNAYLARRALDYLIGFGISPLLWKKLPCCRSAGRVQSAALALICDREMEIEHFKPQEYWTVGVDFQVTCLHSSVDGPPISSQLTHFDSKKLDRFSICSRSEAEVIEKRVYSSKFEVQGIKNSTIHKNPPMPYITSTLQQDSANKLHFSSTQTMKLAQKLYEGVKLSDKEATGLITYMRTDGLHMSNEAAEDIRSLVRCRYGEEFAAKCVRKHFKKVKNAQEAHEAIRPTNIRRLPSSLVGILDDDSLKLYSLIWSRTMAGQMEPSATDMIQVDIGSMDGDMILRSVDSKVVFPGFMAAYQDREAGVVGIDDNEDDGGMAAYEVLRKLQVKDELSFNKVDIQQHHTKPPARFSEGALVKKLEELGIGRPSTYASTMKVLQDRNYVTIKSRTLLPDFRGRMVSEFVTHHFSEVADYSFTADMENELDNVSAGTTDWRGLLQDYWARFSKSRDLASKVDNRQVEKMLEKKFDHLLFDALPNKGRVCPSCSVGTLSFKVSKYGAGWFIGCDQHPRCRYIVNDENPDSDPSSSDIQKHAFEPKLLGICHVSNQKVYIKKGPYGFYVQLGDNRKGTQQKRVSLSGVKDAESISLEGALELLKYPLMLGKHPDDGYQVTLAHSKDVFTIRHRRKIAPVPKKADPTKITLEDAVKFLLSSKTRSCGGRPKASSKKQVEEFSD